MLHRGQTTIFLAIPSLALILGVGPGSAAGGGGGGDGGGGPRQKPTHVVITDPGDDFPAGGSSTLTVEVQDRNNRVVTNATTDIAFNPTLSGVVESVVTGTLQSPSSLPAAPGAPVIVQVATGEATIMLTDRVIETFEVAIDNSQSLSNPLNDIIVVTPPQPTQAVITDSHCTFVVGGSTNLTVQVQFANGNVETGDNATEITFDPSLSGTVTAVVKGTLKPGETLDVLGAAVTVIVDRGEAAVRFTDNVVETFQVASANNAGLSNPPNYNIVVTASPSPVTVSLDPRGLEASGADTFEVLDAGGAQVFRGFTDLVYDLQLIPGSQYTIAAVGTSAAFDFMVCGQCDLRVVP